MEVLFLPTKTLFLSPTSSLSTLHNKFRFKLRNPLLKPFSKPLFTSNSRLPNAKTSPVTARFNRPSNRRNSLRKKLTHDYSQVRRNPPEIVDPLLNFVDFESEQGNFEMGTVEIDSKESNFDNLAKGLGDSESAMRSKLDSWVEQYKEDIAFWGIGSNPIFTVFRGSSGNVERVSLDEDEILRRSGVEPLYYREDRELEVFREVNSKITRGRFLAREMENGKDVGLKHSSVVKFVSEGESSTFVGRVRSLSLTPNLLPKVSKVGIGMVCGVLSVWAMKKLFTLSGDDTEVTRFEKEMVRRKIKSRMEKEMFQGNNVEVVEEPYEEPAESMERPHIDKDKLLDNIREAKGLNNVSPKMDAKIQEIQMMARYARKIEREERSKTEGDELDEKISSELPKMKDLDEEDLVDIVTGDDVFKIQASNEIDTSLQQVKDHQNPSIELSDGPEFINGITETYILGDIEPKTVVSEDIEDVELQSSADQRVIEDESSQIDRLVDTSLQQVEDHQNLINTLSDGPECVNGITGTYISGNKELKAVVSEDTEDVKPQSSGSRRVIDDESNQIDNTSHLSVLSSDVLSSKGSSSQQNLPKKKVPERRKPKIILSVTEARKYLSKKHDQTPQNDDIHECEKLKNGKAPDASVVNEVLNREFDDVKEDGVLETNSNGMDKKTRIRLTQTKPQSTHIDPKLDLGNRSRINKMPKNSNLDEASDLVPPSNSSHEPGHSSEAIEDCNKNGGHDENMAGKVYSQTEDSLGVANKIFEKNAVLPNGISDVKVSGKNNGKGKPPTLEAPKGFESEGANKEGGPFTDKESWLEKNFQEVEPLMKKIGTGFRNNYMVAREKVHEETNTGLDLANLMENTELEWMQDDKLTEIVFRVRDNELADRDPFHSMDPEDKVAFFEGLERKAEKESEKLATLHQWLHSNIENIDYGADGISIYDPPEKVIPRWKGPPIDKVPQFFSNNAPQQVDASSLQMADESSKIDNRHVPEETSVTKSRPKNKGTKTPKTLIEASDGSIKPGKKSGKEFWQHTKKVSPGFVESYNAETDPDVKSTMKDIGKDLDRWITEKEIQEAADVMDQIPQRGKEIIEKKLNKVRREMEMFGPAAVVSKYREYSDVKEEDYLWWLDLPYVLCIELYTYEGEEQKVGFYALEMATDLEINPKPNHVIAFEDPCDCKNLCYIIQAHLEMLGRGRAFVIAQTPKDAFREAKSNGFGVTVIRKRELQLNIDQPLEEVEELITEIGSKMYHDKLMSERSIDISALTKGVFGVSDPSKRRRKTRKLKKPSKP